MQINLYLIFFRGMRRVTIDMLPCTQLGQNAHRNNDAPSVPFVLNPLKDNLGEARTHFGLCLVAVGSARSQCANVDIVDRPLPRQLRPVVAPASPLLSAGSSRLRSLVLSWMMHWSQSSGSSSMRKPRQMMNTAMRRTVLKWMSPV